MSPIAALKCVVHREIWPLGHHKSLPVAGGPPKFLFLKADWVGNRASK